MRLCSSSVLGFVVGATQAVSAQAASPRGPSPSGAPPEIARAIDSVEARFERALARRDRAALEDIIAAPFTWVHASDGRVDSRDGWLAASAQGMALTGFRSIRTEHGPVLTAYGAPQPHTVVRVARVQIVDSAGTRESWFRQTHVFARGDDGSWRMTLGQGTLMYEGQRLDPALHARYGGTFVLPDGRTLTLAWADGALFATLPNGATAQIFLGSPTEEVVRTVGSGRLRFTLDSAGRPVTAALVRGDAEVWRATRRAP